MSIRACGCGPERPGNTITVARGTMRRPHDVGMTEEEGRPARSAAGSAGAVLRAIGRAAARALTRELGGAERTRVVLMLAAVLALSSADATTVGASATHLRSSLHISNTDIGLLVSVTSIVAAIASLPFGVLADRGQIYGYILGGELIGAGVGFAVTGDIAALSWRAAFVILAIPAFVLAWLMFRLPEPARGGATALVSQTAPAAPIADARPPRETDAQRLARERGLEPDPELVLTGDPRRLGLVAATRYILRIRTNVVLIAASACGYYFLAGVQTFGIEFTTKQYGIDQALASLLLLVVGGGAVVGVLAGGAIGDLLLHRGYLNGRILVAALTATAAVILFAPAIFTRSALTAVAYLTVAAQALSPLLFGAVSDFVFGGGRSGLQWTFALMLLPLTAGAYFLFKALWTYP